MESASGNSIKLRITSGPLPKLDKTITRKSWALFISLTRRTSSPVWCLIRPWLDEVTAAKTNVLGRHYREALLAQIPEEPQNLPMDLGGTCQCVGGCSLSDAGPWQEVGQLKRMNELAML
ncbi:hypothetical protein Clacol_006544, partial [Clathrus columnatus]